MQCTEICVSFSHHHRTTRAVGVSLVSEQWSAVHFLLLHHDSHESKQMWGSGFCLRLSTWRSRAMSKSLCSPLDIAAGSKATTFFLDLCMRCAKVWNLLHFLVVAPTLSCKASNNKKLCLSSSIQSSRFLGHRSPSRPSF